MKKCLIILLGFLISSGSIIAQNHKLLIIGIDGCRADALLTANTPNIDILINNSTYTTEGLTEAPTWSGVGWSGMLTGVWKDKHGVNDNSFTGSNFSQWPHFFNRIEACNSAMNTASIVHWSPINSNILDQVDYELSVGTDQEVSDNAVSYLSNNDPDVLFLHYDDVDHAGHNFGFSPTVAQYISAIEMIDAHVNTVMTALQNRPNYENENWMVILGTDHGGNQSGHGGSSLIERTVFVVASGDKIPNQELTAEISSRSMPDNLSINGVDNFIDLQEQSSYGFATAQDFTIECYVRMSLGQSGDPVILSDKNWASGANKGFIFSFNFSNSSVWKVNIGDGTDRIDINGGNIADGEWHHLVASFDRDGLLTMYQDGALVAAEDMSSIDDIDGGYPFTIGQDGTHSYGDWFNGEIAEVRMWNKVLEANTISAYACSTIDSSHPDFNNLIGYWKIDEGSGSTLVDLSSLQNNGNVIGSANWLGQMSTINCIDNSMIPKIVDIAATGLEYICGAIDPAWNIDGVPLIATNNLISLNDICADARSLSCGVNIQGSTQNASTTGQPNDNCSVGNGDAALGSGIWHSFIGNGSINIISSCSSEIDTKIHVYSGNCADLVCIASDANNACSGDDATVIFTSLINEEYWVLVSGENGTVGDFELNLSCENSCLEEYNYYNNQNLPNLTKALNHIEINDFVSPFVKIKSNQTVELQAGNYILLGPEFEVELGAKFEVKIEDCN